jgi:hypothetical protein
MRTVAESLQVLRAAHPSFEPVADTLVDLANDETVSPEVYTRMLDAVFIVLYAWLTACEHLDESYARRFPGMTSTDDGISYQLPLAAETMKGWRP